MASLNKQLHIFSQFSMINLIKPGPSPLGIRHEVLALAHEGMWLSAIAGCVGLTRATLNCIMRRHAALWTLVPGKSTRAPQKTTPRLDCTLFRMVQQDRFINARVLMAWIKNMYGMRARQQTFTNQLLPHGYHAYRPTRKSLLTANHSLLCLEWARG